MPTLPIPDEPLQQVLLDILDEHRGPGQRIRRADLRAEASRRLRVRIGDRLMRRALEELRTCNTGGAWICSDTEGGGGYFLSRDLKELEAYLDADEARIVTLARRIRAQRRLAGLAETKQLSLDLGGRP